MAEESKSLTAAALETWLVRHTAIRRETLFADNETVGDWQLLALLGRGGSGEVWRARRLSTGETAAVKFLHRTSPEARTRFLRERALLESIHLPGVSRFIAAGEANGIPFLATEELQDYPFPSDDDGVAALLLALIPALAALHRIGIIHRDIKPTNIMGRPDASGRLTPVLIDLGLLKQLTPDGLPATGTLSVVEGHAVGVGTPGYAAPEQFIGGDLSPATDIHALGMLANHCFNGTPPPAWVSIIRRATSSIPSQRYATVLDLAHAIHVRHRLRNIVRTLAATATLAVLGVLSFGLVRTLALRDLHARDHVYVSSTASTPGNGTAKRPFATIREGIASVNPFGTVTVGPGTYSEHLVLNTKPIHLEAPAGPEQTLVRGHWGAAVITVSDLASDSTVSGFTFTGGGGFEQNEYNLVLNWAYEGFGGGAYCSTPVRFTRCRFLENGNRADTNRTRRAILGGGVMVNNATVKLLDCLVTNNYAEVAGGGLAAIGSNACLIVTGGQIAANGVGPISQNASIQLGGIVLLRDASAQLADTVLFGNTGEQLGVLPSSDVEKSSILLERCSVEGGARANGIPNFEADFASRRDYRP